MSSELKDLLLLIDKFLEESNAKPSAIRLVKYKNIFFKITKQNNQFL